MQVYTRTENEFYNVVKLLHSLHYIISYPQSIHKLHHVSKSKMRDLQIIQVSKQ